MTTQKTTLIQRAIALAERSTDLTAQSRLQQDVGWGQRLYRRAERCQRYSITLMKRAGALGGAA